MPVSFDDGADKNSMLNDPLFQYAYVIDGQIGYIHDEPANYVVLAIHDKIPKP